MMFFGARPIMKGSYSNIEVEHDGLATAMYESFSEWEEFKGKFDIAMANMYENWIMDTEHTEQQKIAVYEGVLGDAWTKIKNFFKAIGEKIMSWIKSVIKFFQVQFMNDKSFIEKFKDQLEEDRDEEKFTYNAHIWAWDVADSILKTATDRIKIIAGTFDKTVNDYSNDNIKESSTDTSKKTKEEKKTIDKAMWTELKNADGTGGIAKFKTAYAKMINGGEAKSCKGFNKGMKKDEMIKWLEDEANDKLENVKQAADDIKEATDEYSDKIDAVVSKHESDKDAEGKSLKSNWSKAVTAAADLAKYALSYGTATTSTYEEQLKACSSECRSILNSYVRRSVKKESYGYRSNNNSISLMDSWSSSF